MTKATSPAEPSPGDSLVAAVEIPDGLGLMWRMFAQPYRLRELLLALGVPPELSAGDFRRRLVDDDPRVRRLLTRLLTIPAWCLLPTVPIAAVAALLLPGFSWTWLLVGTLGGACSGLVMVPMLGPLRGIMTAAILSPGLGLLLAVLGAPHALVGPAWAVWAGFLYGSAGALWNVARRVLSKPSRRRIAIDLVAAVVIGAALETLGGGVPFVLAAVAAYVVGILHLPFFLLAAATGVFAARTRSANADAAAAKARWLLFLRHDLLPFALPGLEGVLVDIATADPDLGRRLLDRASNVPSQREIAEHALDELRTRALEDVARGRAFDGMLRGEQTFLDPTKSGWLAPFFDAAKNLQAARASRLHHNRRERLTEARRKLRSEQEHIVGIAQLLPREHQRRSRALRLWLKVVDDEFARLEHDERESPQVPTPFVAGPVLREEHQAIFKGRADLVAKIEHFMSHGRRGTMLLLGQRRMGKSSLVNMLPRMLGTGTRLLRLSFQGLSGEDDKAHPHRIVAERLSHGRVVGDTGSIRRVHGALQDLDRPPTASAWSHTLEWMSTVDRRLRDEDGHVLIAIDEVERIEDGIREGWADTSFLDFVRAAGDRLDNIRILMTCAHPLHRIGPHWADRLISAITIDLSYLEEDEARELCCPFEVFHTIYPPGGVERIIHETHRHPYLIQLVCDELCHQLNEDGRLRATTDDIDLAFVRALGKAKLLFRHLWDLRNDEERKLLRLLAEQPRSLPGSEARRWLEDEGYICKGEIGFEIAVPMFRRWVVESSIGA